MGWRGVGVWGSVLVCGLGERFGKFHKDLINSGSSYLVGSLECSMHLDW